LKHTITSNEEVNRLFIDARKSVQSNLIVLCAAELPKSGQAGRVAYLAGKRLGSAPKRNRAKRLLREAARLEGAPWPGFRVVLVARHAGLECGVETFRSDLARAFRELCQNGPKAGRVAAAATCRASVGLPVPAEAQAVQTTTSPASVSRRGEGR
jgi:ribonuclease P protein component